MTEEISRQLGEIAELLQRRIGVAERAQQFQEEAQEESRKNREETMERLSDMPKLDIPSLDLGFDQDEHREQMRRIEERGEEDRRERAEFHVSLITALDRQNEILERIAAGLEKRG